MVEDEPAIRTFVAILLEDEGFVVETAVHGREALAKARQPRPDLIILDLRMPVRSGWEFITIWQADSATRCIPIVVTSAEASVTTAQALGVHAFLRKPLDVDRLLTILTALSG